MFETIETILKNRKITIYRLSKETGICKTTLESWKNRKNYLSFEKLCKIADFLEVDLNIFRKKLNKGENETDGFQKRIIEKNKKRYTKSEK